MCGIVGMVGRGPVNQEIYDALLLLQHRGQDSTGIATAERNGVFHIAKAKGQVREAFRTRDMRVAPRQHRPRPRALRDEGHRLQRRRGAAVLRERAVRHRPRAQRQPHQHARAHRASSSTRTAGTSTRAPTPSCSSTCSPTSCRRRSRASTSTPSRCSRRSSRVHERVEGSYAAIALIAGYGLLAFRDPFGIRPLILGTRKAEDGKYEWIVASESLVLENGGFEVVRDVDARRGGLHRPRRPPAHEAVRGRTRSSCPCSFEYVYLARPDSIMNGISVYEARLRLGDRLADTIAKYTPDGRDRRRHADPRLVAPGRDAGRAQARHRVPRGLLQEPLHRPDVHHARAGGAQEERAAEAQRDVERVQGQERPARSTTRSCAARPRRRSSRWRGMPGPRSVTFASAAPPVRYPHVYGINMPSRHELVAHGRTIPEIAEELGADYMVYQEVEDLQGRDPRGLRRRGPRHELLRRPATSPAR